MKAPIVLLLSVLCASAFPSEPVLIIAGKTYRDATVRPEGAYTARITHGVGTARVPAWDLTRDQQTRYGFNPAAVANERDRLAAQQRAAEAERKEHVRLEELARAQKAAQEAAALAAAAEKKNAAWENRLIKIEARIRDLDAEIPHTPWKYSYEIPVLASSEQQLHIAIVARGLRDNGPMSMATFMTLSESSRLAAMCVRGAVRGLDPRADMEYERDNLASEAAHVRKEAGIQAPTPRATSHPQSLGLIGKNRDEVRARLGEPVEEGPEKSLPVDRFMRFEKNGISVMPLFLKDKVVAILYSRLDGIHFGSEVTQLMKNNHSGEWRPVGTTKKGDRIWQASDRSMFLTNCSDTSMVAVQTPDYIHAKERAAANSVKGL